MVGRASPPSLILMRAPNSISVFKGNQWAGRGRGANRPYRTLVILNLLHLRTNLAEDTLYLPGTGTGWKACATNSTELFEQDQPLAPS
jgi:hypothetical protein